MDGYYFFFFVFENQIIYYNELSLGCLSNALKYKAVQIITVYWK